MIDDEVYEHRQIDPKEEPIDEPIEGLTPIETDDNTPNYRRRRVGAVVILIAALVTTIAGIKYYASPNEVIGSAIVKIEDGGDIISSVDPAVDQIAEEHGLDRGAFNIVVPSQLASKDGAEQPGDEFKVTVVKNKFLNPAPYGVEVEPAPDSDADETN